MVRRIRTKCSGSFESTHLHAALVPKRHDASLCAVKTESSTKEREKHEHAAEDEGSIEFIFK